MARRTRSIERPRMDAVASSTRISVRARGAGAVAVGLSAAGGATTHANQPDSEPRGQCVVSSVWPPGPPSPQARTNGAERSSMEPPCRASTCWGSRRVSVTSAVGDQRGPAASGPTISTRTRSRAEPARQPDRWMNERTPPAGARRRSLRTSTVRWRGPASSPRDATSRSRPQKQARPRRRVRAIASSSHCRASSPVSSCVARGSPSTSTRTSWPPEPASMGSTYCRPAARGTMPPNVWRTVTCAKAPFTRTSTSSCSKRAPGAPSGTSPAGTMQPESAEAGAAATTTPTTSSRRSVARRIMGPRPSCVH